MSSTLIMYSHYINSTISFLMKEWSNNYNISTDRYQILTGYSYYNPTPLRLATYIEFNDPKVFTLFALTFDQQDSNSMWVRSNNMQFTVIPISKYQKIIKYRVNNEIWIEIQEPSVLDNLRMQIEKWVLQCKNLLKKISRIKN
jgi:hypothetical protein